MRTWVVLFMVSGTVGLWKASRQSPDEGGKNVLTLVAVGEITVCPAHRFVPSSWATPIMEAPRLAAAKGGNVQL
jgi:hypothetical protein